MTADELSHGLCAQSLTFTVAVLPAQQSSVKYPGGAASAAVGEATQGVGTPLVTSVAAGGQLTDVVLFIDANSQALQRPAATKDWWGGCWGCGNSWSNNNWGGGNSWGWGGNNGWCAACIVLGSFYPHAVCKACNGCLPQQYLLHKGALAWLIHVTVWCAPCCIRNNGWNNNGWNNNNNNANINNNNVNSNGWSSGSSTNINNNNVNSGTSELPPPGSCLDGEFPLHIGHMPFCCEHSYTYALVGALGCV